MTFILCTSWTASRAAMTRMSAHETVIGHSSSSRYLILSITSNPRKEFTFGPASFSLVMPSTLSRSTDASHPYSSFHQTNRQEQKKVTWAMKNEKLKRKMVTTITKQSWKCKRSREAAKRGSFKSATSTLCLTMSSAKGHFSL